MKLRPHTFDGGNADLVIKNDLPPQELGTILRGTAMFEEFTGLVAGGLPTPTEHTAFTVSAIYAAVNLISGAISALTMNIYSRARDGERTLQASDDLHWILNEQMTPRWSAANGWEFVSQALLLHGDGFFRIWRDRNGVPTGLEPIHPNRVYVLLNSDGSRLLYVISPDPLLIGANSAEKLVLDQDDVLHIAGFGFDGRRGLSPLRYALRMTGAVALATQDYSARFFANGARPDYALQSDAQIGPEKAEEMQERIDARHRGHQHAHRPMILGSGLKVQPISLPAEDMQLIATRQFQIEEIARVYGLPAFMIGHTENTAWVGTGITSLGSFFVRYALRQHLNKIENEINRKLFRTAAKVAAFDTSELEKADPAAFIASLRTAVGGAGAPGIMTPNEARSRLSLPKIKDGDTLFSGAPNAPTAPAQPAGA